MNHDDHDTIGNLDTIGSFPTQPEPERPAGPARAAPAETIGGLETQSEDGRIVLAGRYQIVKRLGEGGMGSVWLAEDRKLDDRKVAIKMLPAVLAGKKAAYRQVKAEALMAMKLSHPNIATVRGFEEDESGNPFLVMDYIEGQGLDDILADKGTLSEEETVKLLGPVAASLDYAHAQGVVHRDVKPGNVMVRGDGTPFVLDFGIAREIQETMTRVTGKLSSGTLLYMSPEQLKGRAPKAAQDVYSFAVMAYECLTGAPPFSRGQIEWQIVNEQPDPLPDGVGKALRNGVMAGLAKAPKDRPASCAGVLGLDEAEKREREKRAAEEARRLREEELARARQREAEEAQRRWEAENARARAQAAYEERRREEALEAEREARKAAEARMRKAQEEAARRAAEAMQTEEAKGRATATVWLFAVILAVAVAVGWTWWQDQQAKNASSNSSQVPAQPNEQKEKPAAHQESSSRQGSHAGERATVQGKGQEEAFRDATEERNEAFSAHETVETGARAEMVKRELERAREAKERRSWHAIITAAGNVLKLEPGNAEAKRLKEEAKAQIDEAKKAVEAEQGLEKAREAKKRNAWDEVVAAAEEVLALAPDNVEATTLKAEGEKYIEMKYCLSRDFQSSQFSQRQGDARSTAITTYGGAWGAAAEAAVLRALRWFKNNQGADGGWSWVDGKKEQGKRAAITSLGILAFLAHGETPASEEYGETVTRAIRYVLACQDADGYFYSAREKGSDAAAYEQAICVYALSEAYGMTRIPSLKGAMDKGAAIIVKGIQRPNGGYDYQWKQEGRTDISLGAWCVQAMKAAWMAGCTVPELHDVMELELASMKKHQVESGHFKYSNAKSSPAYANMTAAAVLSMQLLGHADDRAVKDGLKALADEKCVWAHPQDWAMYGWYYITQAKFHEGGASWNKWNNMFAPEFVKHQMKGDDPKIDGAWRSAGATTRDNIDGGFKEDWGEDYAYTTALATLTLTVYYRYPQ